MLRLALPEEPAPAVEPDGVTTTADRHPESGPEPIEREEIGALVEDATSDTPPETAPIVEAGNDTGSPQPETATEMSDAEEPAAETPSVGAAPSYVPDEPIDSEGPERTAEVVRAEAEDRDEEPARAVEPEPETTAEPIAAPSEVVEGIDRQEESETPAHREPANSQAPIKPSVTEQDGIAEAGEPGAADDAAGSAMPEADGPAPRNLRSRSAEPVEADETPKAVLDAVERKVGAVAPAHNKKPLPPAEPAVPDANGPRKEAARRAVPKGTAGDTARASDQDENAEERDVAASADRDIADEEAPAQADADTIADAPAPPKPEQVHLTIDSLEDYELMTPIPVVVTTVGSKEFIAEIPDSGISVTGTSVGRAFLELKDEVCAIYEKYGGRKFLKPETQCQLDALRSYIARSKRRWYIAHH